MVAQVPPLPPGTFDVVLLLEAMLAFRDKETLVEAVSRALSPGGRFAFTFEEGLPLTEPERARMPGADTVWLTPLAEMHAILARAGLVVRRQEDWSRSHRAVAQSLTDAYAGTRRRSLRGSGSGRSTTSWPPIACGPSGSPQAAFARSRW